MVVEFYHVFGLPLRHSIADVVDTLSPDVCVSTYRMFLVKTIIHLKQLGRAAAASDWTRRRRVVLAQLREITFYMAAVAAVAATAGSATTSLTKLAGEEI